MNEDITQEIYFLLIESGYTPEEAQQCCNKEITKCFYELVKEYAKKTAEEWFRMDAKHYKEIIKRFN